MILQLICFTFRSCSRWWSNASFVRLWQKLMDSSEAVADGVYCGDRKELKDAAFTKYLILIIIRAQNQNNSQQWHSSTLRSRISFRKIEQHYREIIRRKFISITYW